MFIFQDGFAIVHSINKPTSHLSKPRQVLLFHNVIREGWIVAKLKQSAIGTQMNQMMLVLLRFAVGTLLPLLLGEARDTYTLGKYI